MIPEQRAQVENNVKLLFDSLQQDKDDEGNILVQAISSQPSTRWEVYTSNPTQVDTGVHPVHFYDLDFADRKLVLRKLKFVRTIN